MVKIEEPKASRALPWVERYRPKNVSDVSSQEAVVSTLLSAIEQKAMPHLLFYGPPGTGKTFVGLLVVRTVLLRAAVRRARVVQLELRSDVIRQPSGHMQHLGRGRSRRDALPAFMRHGERGFAINQTLFREGRKHPAAKGVLGDLFPILACVVRKHRQTKPALSFRLGVAGARAHPRAVARVSRTRQGARNTARRAARPEDDRDGLRVRREPRRVVRARARDAREQDADWEARRARQHRRRNHH